jgi:LCP family protein required for cell wall assembly
LDAIEQDAAHEPRRSAVAAAALGAFVPGLGHGYVGRRGRAALMAFPILLIIGVGVAAVSMSPADLLAWLVRPVVLRWILIANLAIVVWRVAAVADPYRLADGRHSLGRLMVVIGLAVLVALPHVLIARYTLDAAYLLDEVFVEDGEVPVVEIETFDTPPRAAPFAPGDTAVLEVADPATVTRYVQPTLPAKYVFRSGVGDPEAIEQAMAGNQNPRPSLQALIGPEADGVERLTILLVGGDGGPGRGGSRSDAIMVATYDTTTGKAAVFGIPRNMTHVPLPAEWSNAFVDLEKRLIPYAERKKWTDDDGDGEPDQFEPCNCFPDQINAIYPFTRNWVDTYPDEVDPGLAALRDTLELMLDIEIDYYAMVNMSGFVRVIDALGGIRVYVTSRVQTEVSPARSGENWIKVNLSPGWRRLDGHDALAYVRERKTSSDYTRMKRQRCLLKAVAAKADPATILTRFTRISRAVASSVKTDIDVDYLPTMLSYASSLDFDDVATVGFVPPYYTPVVDHRGKPTPDLLRIQAMVRWALSAEDTTEFETGSDSECRI